MRGAGSADCADELGALTIGSADYSLKQIADAVVYGAEGPVQIVIYNLRLPRIIMALEVGACLAVAGALLQSVMRNPLADPGIIGVSAGAATAATTILLLYPAMLSAVRCLLLAVHRWHAF